MGIVRRPTAHLLRRHPLTDPPSSLQLQLGIIAACATSLKPLFNRILRLQSTDRYYNTPARYGYGSRSRGTKFTGANGTIGGTGRRPDDDHDFELETGMRTSGDDNLANDKAANYSTATSFYKHGSPNGSGSEEMILGAAPGVGVVQMPPHALTTDQQGGTRGIVRTTEVRVTVK